MKPPDTISSDSPIPLYFQLQELIRTKIESGEYPTGTKIPSEAELQRRYRVSRMTVRNAIEGLVFEELLIKKQGIGTVVARKRIADDMSSLKSFTEKIHDLHADARTVVLESGHIGASKRIAEHLGIEPESRVLCVKRLRFIDNEPINIFTSYFPSDIGIREDHDFSGSVYQLLEDEYGIRIAQAERTIEAIQATKEEADLLGIKSGDALLLIRNSTLNHQGRVIEYAEGVYRSDRYKYVMHLKR